jgi:hypothetical protein
VGRAFSETRNEVSLQSRRETVSEGGIRDARNQQVRPASGEIGFAQGDQQARWEWVRCRGDCKRERVLGSKKSKVAVSIGAREGGLDLKQEVIK